MTEDSRSFPLVGVGASAGGLDAFLELVRALPRETGMAFVLVQHLDPRASSILADALAKASLLPVAWVTDGTVVERDHVYVAPADADVEVRGGVFHTKARIEGDTRPHHAVDAFLESLAAERGDRAIGVVLTGGGFDGTAGLRAIQAARGVTLAQEPASARFDGMPRAAIDAHVVDLVLPLPELVPELLRIGERLGRADPPSALEPFFLAIQRSTELDLRGYEPSLVERRVRRRMLVRRVEPSRYLELLRDERTEVDALVDELVRHAPARIAEVEAALRREVFPRLLPEGRESASLRVWCVGCGDGRDAYLLAIALAEYLEEARLDLRFQVFGSDLSPRAVERARLGVYDAREVSSFGAHRKTRWFSRTDGDRLRISKAIRDRCAFVRHDLANDPPFSKIDLLCCPNQLGLLSPTLQQRVVHTLHFALGEPGFLLLGEGESVRTFDLFTPLEAAPRILERVRVEPAHDHALRVSISGTSALGGDLVQRSETLLLELYAPPGVLVNERLEILHFRGRTGPFLEPAPGLPQHDLLRMARKGLVADLRMALAEAARGGTVVRRRAAVAQSEAGPALVCDVVVAPVPAGPGRDQAFLVLFEEKTGETAGAQHQLDADLAHELEQTRAYLQSVIEEHQRTNDDLAAANEELHAGNEELQSLNEEVETGKEELQAANEELETLNEELRSRNGELRSVNGDLLNILASVEVPIVIVDRDRRVRRFTPRARAILRLVPGDIGRPIDDLKPTLEVLDLEGKVAGVIESAKAVEEEVQGLDHRWYRLQIRPYLTRERTVDGAVLSIVDVDTLRRALGAAEWARDYARATVEAVSTPLLLIDESLEVLTANESFRERYCARGEALAGEPLREILDGAWNLPELLSRLESVVDQDQRFQGLELGVELGRVGRRTVSFSARRVRTPGGANIVLLSAEDVTEVRRHEAERAQLLEETRAAKESAEQANRTKDLFLATLSHELRTPLSNLMLQAQLLERGHLDPPRLERVGKAVKRAAQMQASLIEDLFDVSRIVAGKLVLDKQPVALAPILYATIDSLVGSLEARQVQLDLAIDETVPFVEGDPPRLQQIVTNLLGNAIKFSAAGQHVRVALDRVEGTARVRVIDEGAGVDPEFLPHLFERFSQADQSATRSRGGLGLGLSIVQALVVAHGGSVFAESAGLGQGSTFTVLLPLVDPSAPSAAPPAPERLEGLRILLVEDDVPTREALVDALEQIGATVDGEESAARAFEAMPRFRPDALVCDLSMPGEDGWSLMRRIRALGPELGRVPALALTAAVGEQERSRSLAAGFDEHMEKPVDLARLTAMLQRLTSVQ